MTTAYDNRRYLTNFDAGRTPNLLTDVLVVGSGVAGLRAVTVHGFRSTFRDWVAEETNYPHQVAEMALAHSIGDKTEAAYLRGDLFDKRIRLMNDWARYVNKPLATANVRKLRTG